MILLCSHIDVNSELEESQVAMDEGYGGYLVRTVLYQPGPPRKWEGGRRNSRSLWDLGNRRTFQIYFRGRWSWGWGWRWRMWCWRTWMQVVVPRRAGRRVRTERRTRGQRRTTDQDLGAQYWCLAMDVCWLDIILGVPQYTWSLLS